MVKEHYWTNSDRYTLDKVISDFIKENRKIIHVLYMEFEQSNYCIYPSKVIIFYKESNV